VGADAGGSRRGPPDYRPDLRPMLILIALVVVVVVGWILLSPVILPGPQGQ
jgi:hypothetical protein